MHLNLFGQGLPIHLSFQVLIPMLSLRLKANQFFLEASLSLSGSKHAPRSLSIWGFLSPAIIVRSISIEWIKGTRAPSKSLPAASQPEVRPSKVASNSLVPVPPTECTSMSLRSPKAVSKPNYPLEAVFEAPSPDPRQTQLIPILVTGTWEQREAQDKEFVLKPFERTKALDKRMGNPLTEIPRPQP